MVLKFPRLTPETIMILPMALFIDLIGVTLVLFGADDLGLLDTIGICFIGSWQLFKAGKVTAPKVKKGSFLRKMFTGKWSKYFVTWGGELIPYVGCLPFWTVAVYFQLMQQEEKQKEEEEEQQEIAMQNEE